MIKQKCLFLLISLAFLFTQCKNLKTDINNKEFAILLDNNKYFELAEKLEQKGSKLTNKEQLYYQAHCNNAFNDIDNSEKNINLLFDKYKTELTDKEKANLLEVRIRNYIRTFRYKKTVKTCQELIKNYSQVLDSTKLNHYKKAIDENSALESVEPSKVFKPQNNIEIKSYRHNILTFTMIPIQYGAIKEDFLFDTGAELSVITKTMANKLGLKLIKAKVNVESSTGQKTEGTHYAIADSLYIGDVLLTNVVFLVMPLFSIPELDFHLHGIIGSPQIMQLGEVKIRKNGSMLLSNNKKTKSKNIFFSSLDGLYPVVQVINDNNRLSLIFDSGANKSDLSVNYYKRFKEMIESKGKVSEVSESGVAGSMTKKSYELSNFKFKIKKHENTLTKINVLTEQEDDFEFDGTIGQDMLLKYDEVTVNLNKMYIEMK